MYVTNVGCYFVIIDKFVICKCKTYLLHLYRKSKSRTLYFLL